MSHFSDSAHLETCAGTHCRVMALRSAMHRVPGKRGWFCDHCVALHYFSRNDLTQSEL